MKRQNDSHHTTGSMITNSLTLMKFSLSLLPMGRSYSGKTPTDVSGKVPTDFTGTVTQMQNVILFG